MEDPHLNLKYAMSGRPLLGRVKTTWSLAWRDALSILGSLGAIFALTGMVIGSIAISKDHRPYLPPSVSDARTVTNYLYRINRAHENAALPQPPQESNGDEEFYSQKLAAFTKGMQHNSLGEVDLDQFELFVHALDTRQFNLLPLAPGAEKRYANPQAALALHLVGGDVLNYAMPPPPVFNSSELAAEYVENTWMAVTRDVPFTEYATSVLIAEAAADLDSLGSNFTGPSPVTPANLFRGLSEGCDQGPYMSQFFYLPMMYGMHQFNLKVQPRAPGVDFMTSFGEYLNIQNGLNPSFTEQLVGSPRYIISGRDIANWVHVDIIWQAYHMAALTLGTLNAPYNPTNPYLSLTNQEEFSTFGVPDVVTKIAEVAGHALNIVKYQKWFVHRRFRPEAFGARVHVNKTMGTHYPIHPTALDTPANGYIYAATGTYLLPQAFPEGCPMHPAYGAGHGTVAGACATVMKAFFDESWIIPDPVVPDATGANLLAISANLTVGGEINKIANNVAIGRNIAGVHWRSDATESLRLGEQIAIDFLRDYKGVYHENFMGWRFKRFDGTQVVI